MSEFDSNMNFRLGLLNNNSGGTSGGDGLANKVESPEILLKAADKALGTTAKLIGSNIPIPVNFGEVSAFSGLETGQEQDWASKKINQAAGNLSSRGGALYNLLAPLLADGTIKDHFSHPGSGDSGGFLESPSFIGAAGDFSSHAAEPMDYGGSGNFGATGQLAPPDLPVVSSGRGEGYSPD